MKKIAILGGTFNPVHNGHLKLAENTWRQFSLDEFWFLPSPNPPHKQGRTITDFSHRFAMTKLAIRKYPSFVCSDFETRRTGKSYTSDTLTELKQLHPDTEFYFVMGADSFYEFGSWHEPGIIAELAVLVVAERDYEKNHLSLNQQAEYLKEKYNARVRFIRAAEVDISSEQIRTWLENGKKNVGKYLPDGVLDYIRAHHLYEKNDQ